MNLELYDKVGNENVLRYIWHIGEHWILGYDFRTRATLVGVFDELNVFGYLGTP